jgi:hypothetical protein
MKNTSLCNLCVLCVSVIDESEQKHATENTEAAQRNVKRELEQEFWQ